MSSFINFSGYDAFLFPTFSENYGHVIVEALSVGTLVIISDRTPWNDVEESGVGWAIALDNTIKFKEVINQVIAFGNRHETSTLPVSFDGELSHIGIHPYLADVLILLKQK